MARAICEALGELPEEIDELTERQTGKRLSRWRRYAPAAAAALHAIREPSEGMVVDALDHEALDSRATSRNIWQAMIDAALRGHA